MSTIKNLVDLATLVESGKTEFTGLSDKSIARLLSFSEEARKGNIQIQQKPKQIDMTPFLHNGLDCVFNDGHGVGWFIGRLASISVHTDEEYEDENDLCYEHCRPRLNHPFVWEGQELPEGLVVEYGHWNNEYELIWETTPLKYGNHIARILGCKEGYTFVGE